MKLRKMEMLNLVFVAAIFAAAAYLYPALPERVASHWNAQGQVNGYMGRFWGAFFVPFMAFVLDLVFLAVPRIDPKKENIEKFRKSFDLFVSLFLVFLSYIYALTLLWAFNHHFNMTQMMIPAFSLLFFAMAVLVQNAEPNWSIGIRTPWTLSSEAVWRKTHAFGGKLFTIAAALTLLGLLFPAQALWFALIPIIACSIAVVVYSYLEFTKLPRP